MANPPITIGPFVNVPAPGSPIRSDWAQSITQFVVDHFTWTAWADLVPAANFAFPGGPLGKAQVRYNGDQVQVRGNLYGGPAAASGAVCTSLPVGPAMQLMIPSVVANIFGYLLVNTNGTVQAFGAVPNAAVGLTFTFGR